MVDGQLLYSISHEHNCYDDISPDGQILAIGGSPITLYRLNDGTRLRQLQITGHPKFSSDGKVLAISYSTSDDKLLLYRLQDDMIIGALLGLEKRVTGFALSPDGQYLVAAYSTGGGNGDIIVGFGSSDPIWSHLALWRLVDFSPEYYPRQILRTQKHSSLPSSALAFSPDGKILAFGGWDDTVRLWRIPPQPSWLFQVLLFGSISGGLFWGIRYRKKTQCLR